MLRIERCGRWAPFIFGSCRPEGAQKPFERKRNALPNQVAIGSVQSPYLFEQSLSNHICPPYCFFRSLRTYSHAIISPPQPPPRRIVPRPITHHSWLQDCTISCSPRPRLLLLPCQFITHVSYTPSGRSCGLGCPVTN